VHSTATDIAAVLNILTTTCQIDVKNRFCEFKPEHIKAKAKATEVCPHGILQVGYRLHLVGWLVD